ncbi:MAG: aminoglycoside 6-adenylyltransferase [Anaerolineae bacterium]|nr:aminoglycoside 6-adenylyltransferase [Anaerolineae bacterium]
MNDVLQEDAILQNLIQWGTARDAVRTMILTSTRTSPHAHTDAFSDYDVIVYMLDIYPWHVDDSWLEDFGRVLVVYRDPIQVEYGCEKFARITQYEDGLKIDFTVAPVEILPRIVAVGRLPDDLDVGYAVLIDKDGLTEHLLPPTYTAYVPAPPTEEHYLTRIEVFFHEATYVAKHLWRDDLMPVKYNLDYAMKHVGLRQMLEWWIETQHGWSVKPGAYGKGLKRWLPPDLWAELEATYVGADLDANWEAMLRTIALYRKVAVEVGNALGYAYPHEMDTRAMAYFRRVKRLDRQAETLQKLLIFT